MVAGALCGRETLAGPPADEPVEAEAAGVEAAEAGVGVGPLRILGGAGLVGLAAAAAAGEGAGPSSKLAQAAAQRGLVGPVGTEAAGEGAGVVVEVAHPVIPTAARTPIPRRRYVPALEA